MVNKSKDIKRLKLREIADLTVGYSIPGRINDDPNGNVHLLQISDLLSDGYIKKYEVKRIHAPKNIETKCLLPGDLLICARGKDNRVSIYRGEFKMAAAMSSIVVVRIKPEFINTIEPGYLLAYLNSVSAQDWFSKNALGATIIYLDRDTIASIEVSIPSLEDQRCISKLMETGKKEIQNLDKLVQLKQQFLEKTLERMLTNQSKKEI